MVDSLCFSVPCSKTNEISVGRFREQTESLLAVVPAEALEVLEVDRGSQEVSTAVLAVGHWLRWHRPGFS